MRLGIAIVASHPVNRRRRPSLGAWSAAAARVPHPMNHGGPGAARSREVWLRRDRRHVEVCPHVVDDREHLVDGVVVLARVLDVIDLRAERCE